MDSLPDPYRRKKTYLFFWSLTSAFLITAVFLLGIFLTTRDQFSRFISPTPVEAGNNLSKEVFGFAPYWNLSKLEGINWDVLTTFAYFSLPVNNDGSIDKTSYEWDVFNGPKVKKLFDTARAKNVKTVVTLTQMEAPTIEAFLDNPESWKVLANETSAILEQNNLDGVNIDIEYIPSSTHYREKFSEFMTVYSDEIKKQRDQTYLTVSVLASSQRFSKIYDVGHLASVTDGVLMMAYDFYYRGSESAGPTAPLNGYNNGKGPYWYDVSTAVEDFLKVASPSKIILGVPYYGWDFPTSSPAPLAASFSRAAATTNEKAQKENLIKLTPIGGWDDEAKVSWRGYYDHDGWHTVYIEDKKSLSYKYDFVKEKSLQGVGIWALGYDNGDQALWDILKEKFSDQTYPLASLDIKNASNY